jgi:hypothetical protein
LHGFNQFVRAARSFGVLGWLDDVDPNMILDHFCHETVHRPARRDDQVKHRGAPLFFFKRPLDGFDLTANTTNSI